MFWFLFFLQARVSLSSKTEWSCSSALSAAMETHDAGKQISGSSDLGRQLWIMRHVPVARMHIIATLY